jgi:hypothetical protein
MAKDDTRDGPEKGVGLGNNAVFEGPGWDRKDLGPYRLKGIWSREGPLPRMVQRMV